MAVSGRYAANGNGSPNWQVALMGIAVLLSFLFSVFGLVNPRDDIKGVETRAHDLVLDIERRIQTEIGDLKSSDRRLATSEEVKRVFGELASIKSDMKDLVSRREHDQYILRKDKDTDNLSLMLRDLHNDVVSRSEHIQHWKDNDEKVSALRQQLSDILKDYVPKDRAAQLVTELNERMSTLSMRLTKDEEQTYGTYNPGKQLENLQGQIGEIRRQLNELAALTPAARSLMFSTPKAVSP